MSQVTQLCDQIVGHLARIGSPIGTLLRPGLSEQEVQNAERGLPFAFPDSVVELYRWHNGSGKARNAHFFPWWTFDAFQQSLDRYRVLAGPKDDLWAANWFPLFSTSDISTIGICCDASPTRDAEIVCFEYMLGPQVEYLNLETMLRTILSCYETGVFFMGEEGQLERDDAAFNRIAQQFNPGLTRWTE